MIHAVRRLQFCMGHRVWKHESSCRHLHGHNYVVFFHAQAPQLDSIGRVIDFGVLKQKLGGWIDENWDHGFILHRDDSEAIRAVLSLSNQRLYLIPYNPTAENIGDYLLNCVGPKALEGTDVELVKVEVWETENCCAVVTPNDVQGGTHGGEEVHSQ